MLVENINIYAKEITKLSVFKSALKPLQKVFFWISHQLEGGTDPVACILRNWKYER